MKSTSPQDMLSELHALSQYFCDAEAEIKNGKLVDMSGVETKVGEICQRVQDSVPEEQQIFLPELTTLLSRLDSCELAIRMKQTELTEPPQDKP